jgi:hypothetical protein
MESEMRDFEIYGADVPGEDEIVTVSANAHGRSENQTMGIIFAGEYASGHDGTYGGEGASLIVCLESGVGR